MKRFLGLFLLLSCGPTLYGEPECVSPCGLRLQNTPLLNQGQHEGWSCAGLDRTEAEALEAFDTHVIDPRFQGACRKLNGARVAVEQPAAFYSKERQGMVRGQTYCAERMILLGNDLPEFTALTHELSHLLQGCVPSEPNPDGDPHGNWTRDGINAAIDQVYIDGESYSRDHGWL